LLPVFSSSSTLEIARCRARGGRRLPLEEASVTTKRTETSLPSIRRCSCLLPTSFSPSRLPRAYTFHSGYRSAGNRPGASSAKRTKSSTTFQASLPEGCRRGSRYVLNFLVQRQPNVHCPENSASPVTILAGTGS